MRIVGDEVCWMCSLSECFLIIAYGISSGDISLRMEVIILAIYFTAGLADYNEIVIKNVR